MQVCRKRWPCWPGSALSCLPALCMERKEMLFLPPRVCPPAAAGYAWAGMSGRTVSCRSVHRPPCRPTICQLLSTLAEHTSHPWSLCTATQCM